jgi:hypothetical protein
MAAVSDTRSIDIEDDIKLREPPIHPPIYIRLVLRPAGRGSSCTPVEEPTCQWSPLAGGGAHTSVESCAGGRARSLVLGRLATGGRRWRWRGTLAHRRPISTRLQHF